MPLASLTSINKRQVMQNAALRTATGCTQVTNIQHLHDETHISHTRATTVPRLTIQKENKSSITSAIQTHFNTPRLKNTIFNNDRYSTNIPTCKSHFPPDIKTNVYHIHTSIVSRHLCIAPIAQLVSALDFNFERAVEGSILTAGKRLSENSECNNLGYKLTGLTWWS